MVFSAKEDAIRPYVTWSDRFLMGLKALRQIKKKSVSIRSLKENIPKTPRTSANP